MAKALRHIATKVHTGVTVSDAAAPSYPVREGFELVTHVDTGYVAGSRQVLRDNGTYRASTLAEQQETGWFEDVEGAKKDVEWSDLKAAAIAVRDDASVPASVKELFRQIVKFTRKD